MERMERLWGAGSLDECFAGHGKVVCPWPRAPRSRGVPDARGQVTAAMVHGPVHLSEVDPRRLYASQGWVVRQHVDYYLTGAWERTGVTSADRDNAANRYPIVVVDHRGRLVIATGHHRSLVALIEGRPLPCRLVPAEPDEAEALLPHLLVGPSTRVQHVVASTVDEAVELVRSGQSVLCHDRVVATRACRALMTEATGS
jgi:hypothetical protein